jgi:hypothetical protein
MSKLIGATQCKNELKINVGFLVENWELENIPENRKQVFINAMHRRIGEAVDQDLLDSLILECIEEATS